jgi:hypothetical protein
MAVRVSFSKMARGLVAGVLVMGSVAAATPALAHVVEVTTALEMPESQDASAMKAALQKAVERVLADTIAFKPTMVALTDARVMGEKLLVKLLIADADGERMLKDLQEQGTGSASPDEDEDSPQPRQIRI